MQVLLPLLAVATLCIRAGAAAVKTGGDFGGWLWEWDGPPLLEAPPGVEAHLSINTTLPLPAQDFESRLLSNLTFVSSIFDAGKDLDVQLGSFVEEGDGWKRRAMTYRHPVATRFPGIPSHATTKKTQALAWQDDGWTMVEQTRVEDIPYSSSFNITSVWRIEPEGGSKSRCRITISLFLQFSSNIMLRGRIQRDTWKEQGDAFEDWIRLATSAVANSMDALAEEEHHAHEEETEPILVYPSLRTGLELRAGEYMTNIELIPSADVVPHFLTIRGGKLVLLRGSSPKAAQVVWESRSGLGRRVGRLLWFLLPWSWGRIFGASAGVVSLRLRDTGSLELVERQSGRGLRTLWRTKGSAYGDYEAMVTKDGKLTTRLGDQIVWCNHLSS